MLVNRAFKFRMYPNAEQIELINKTIGCSRLVYNIMLSKKKENSKLSKYDMIKEANKSLRRKILNSTMSDIIRRLKYKSQWLNKKLIQVNRYYASSQICSYCGQ